MMTCAGCDLDLEKYREIQRSRGEGRHPEMKYSESCTIPCTARVARIENGASSKRTERLEQASKWYST